MNTNSHESLTGVAAGALAAPIRARADGRARGAPTAHDIDDWRFTIYDWGARIRLTPTSDVDRRCSLARQTRRQQANQQISGRRPAVARKLWRGGSGLVFREKSSGQKAFVARPLARLSIRRSDHSRTPGYPIANCKDASPNTPAMEMMSG